MAAISSVRRPLPPTIVMNLLVDVFLQWWRENDPTTRQPRATPLSEEVTPLLAAKWLQWIFDGMPGYKDEITPVRILDSQVQMLRLQYWWWVRG